MQIRPDIPQATIGRNNKGVEMFVTPIRENTRIIPVYLDKGAFRGNPAYPLYLICPDLRRRLRPHECKACRLYVCTHENLLTWAGAIECERGRNERSKHSETPT